MADYLSNLDATRKQVVANKQAKLDAIQAERDNKNQVLDFFTDWVMPAAGAGIGYLAGGPMGAYAGYEIGSALGGGLDQDEESAGLRVRDYGRADAAKARRQAQQEKLQTGILQGDIMDAGIKDYQNLQGQDFKQQKMTDLLPDIAYDRIKFGG